MRFSAALIEPYIADKQIPSLINQSLDAVNGMLVTELKPVIRFKGPDLASKLLSVRQCVAYRSLDLAEGAISSWEAGDILASVVVARAFMETASLPYWLFYKIEKSLALRDARAIHELSLHVLFAARHKASMLDGLEPATNVFKYLDFLGKQGVEARWAYENLSEFAHPNGRGLHQFYCRIDHDTGVSYFSRAGENRRHFARSLIAAISLILLVERYLTRLEELSERVKIFEDEIGGYLPEAATDR